MDYLMCSSYELTGEADLIRTQFFLPKLLVPVQTWTAELDIGDHADFSS
jgi:hypothetical protein